MHGRRLQHRAARGREPPEALGQRQAADEAAGWPSPADFAKGPEAGAEVVQVQIRPAEGLQACFGRGFGPDAGTLQKALGGPDLDLADLRARLAAFGQICRGRPAGGLIGSLPPAERFRWLTATRSTVLQTSAVHPGLTADAAATLARLFAALVL